MCPLPKEAYNSVKGKFKNTFSFSLHYNIRINSSPVFCIYFYVYCLVYDESKSKDEYFYN